MLQQRLRERQWSMDKPPGLHPTPVLLACHCGEGRIHWSISKAGAKQSSVCLCVLQEDIEQS